MEFPDIRHRQDQDSDVGHNVGDIDHAVEKHYVETVATGNRPVPSLRKWVALKHRSQAIGKPDNYQQSYYDVGDYSSCIVRYKNPEIVIYNR